MKSAVWLRNISATSCPWLSTLQQCGSFVGKRLLVEGLLTALNEGAASTAANQRSSKFLNVTPRLHQTTRTADRSHGNPLPLLNMRDKGLVQIPPPFREPSQDLVVFLSSTFTELLVHSRMSHLFTPKATRSFFLSLWRVWKTFLSIK